MSGTQELLNKYLLCECMDDRSLTLNTVPDFYDHLLFLLRQHPSDFF